MKNLFKKRKIFAGIVVSAAEKFQRWKAYSKPFNTPLLQKCRDRRQALVLVLSLLLCQIQRILWYPYHSGKELWFSALEILPLVIHFGFVFTDILVLLTRGHRRSQWDELGLHWQWSRCRRLTNIWGKEFLRHGLWSGTWATDACKCSS